MEKITDLVKKIQDYDFKLEYKHERNPVIKIKFLALHHLQSGMLYHFVAVDWAISNMAIARKTEKSNDIKIIDVPSSIKEMQLYLKNLKGTICLAIEETSISQWLSLY